MPYIFFTTSPRILGVKMFNRYSLKFFVLRITNDVDFYFLMTYGICKKRKFCNRMSKKKILSFWWMFMFYVLEHKTSKTNFRLSDCLPICLSVCLSGCTWTFAVDTITFEGVSGSKQNLVGVFYVWNVGLVLKSKVKSWSWSWSWSWKWFWFW